MKLTKPTKAKNARRYVLDCLEKNELAQGKYIKLFERKFARYTGHNHALAVSNGTMALYCALKAVGVAGGEVVLPALTFAATADAVIMAGARPVFADVDKDNWCITPKTVLKVITQKTKAIIAVDLYGKIAPVNELKKIGLPVIEDACEGLGGKIQKGDITCFSFFGNKVMTAGEGGMCATDSNDLALKITKIRNHGRLSGFWHETQGTNARMANINAALGLAQLEEFPKNLKWRKEIFDWYGIKDYGAPWLPYMAVKDNREAVKRLLGEGVEAREGFRPLYKMPAYEKKIRLPVSEWLGEHIILLPIFKGLKKSQVKKICKVLFSRAVMESDYIR
jgi:perosamine synthetase